MAGMHGRSWILYVFGVLQGEFATRDLAVTYAGRRFGIPPDVVDVRDHVVRDDDESGVIER